MSQSLKTTELKHEDIRFLKRKLKKHYLGWLIFSLFSIVFPFSAIYAIITNEELDDKAFPILIIIIIFGLWIYLTIAGIIDTIKEHQNLLLQKKVEGNIIVIEKEIVVIKGEDSDTTSYEIKVFAEIEEKHRNISVDHKYYEKIKIGDTIWIEYFLDCNYIKTLLFDGQDSKYKNFTKEKNRDEL